MIVRSDFRLFRGGGAHPTLVPLLTAVAALASSAPSARAQQASSFPAVEARGGLVTYGTGDDVNCAVGAGLTAGGSVRTRGVWQVALLTDFYLAAPAVCTDVGIAVMTEEGVFADVSGGVFLLGDPRVGVRLGRALTRAGSDLIPNVGAGWIRPTPDGPGEERIWNPWLGAGVGVRRGARFGFDVEVGAHRIPVTYTLHDAGGRRRVFIAGQPDHRWRALVQASVVLPVSRPGR